MAQDTDEVLRLAMLLEADLIVAWPAVSGCQANEFLAAVGVQAPAAPVLIVSWEHEMCPVDSVAHWVRPPLHAEAFLSAVHAASLSDLGCNAAEPTLRSREVMGFRRRRILNSRQVGKRSAATMVNQWLQADGRIAARGQVAN